MIYGFARQSGGQVRIYSEVGRGATVCLYLPRHIGEAEAIEKPPEVSQMAHATHGETVLVIDDEPLVRMLVTDVLKELGYAAIEAIDGPSGLKILRSPARIDLLITDIGLPGGMDGGQIAEAARELRPAMKVLFITGFAGKSRAQSRVHREWNVGADQALCHGSVGESCEAACSLKRYQS